MYQFCCVSKRLFPWSHLLPLVFTVILLPPEPEGEEVHKDIVFRAECSKVSLCTFVQLWVNYPLPKEKAFIPKQEAICN